MRVESFSSKMRAHPSLSQGVTLQLRVLGVGGDPGEPDEVVMYVRHDSDRLTTHLRMAGFPAAFCDGF